jgi:hypothetical protein
VSAAIEPVCWQFLDLVDRTVATLDEQIYTLEDMPTILGVLRMFCTRRLTS